MAAELLEQFEPEIEALTLVPMDEGRFEIEVNDKLIYSKLETMRYPREGEISGLIRTILQK